MWFPSRRERTETKLRILALEAICDAMWERLLILEAEQPHPERYNRPRAIPIVEDARRRFGIRVRKES